MREFEELEGLSDQVDDGDTTTADDDDDDDDPSFRPTLAANLNNADIYYEVGASICLVVLFYVCSMKQCEIIKWIK